MDRDRPARPRRLAAHLAGPKRRRDVSAHRRRGRRAALRRRRQRPNDRRDVRAQRRAGSGSPTGCRSRRKSRARTRRVSNGPTARAARIGIPACAVLRASATFRSSRTERCTSTAGTLRITISISTYPDNAAINDADEIAIRQARVWAGSSEVTAMPNRFHCVAAAFFVTALPSTSALASPALLRTAAALDEPRGYCVDISGFRETLRLDDPLQAHTCKYGAPHEDQLFDVDATGAIRTREYDRCLAAADLEEGAKLLARPCANSRTQRWSLSAGRLSPAARPELCVSLQGKRGEIAGTPILISPVYRRRDLALARCGDPLDSLQGFRSSAPDERSISAADVARSGMTRRHRGARSRRSAASSTVRSRQRPRRSTPRSRASTRLRRSTSRRISRTGRTSGNTSTFTRARCIAAPSRRRS